jgi:hypothetical protein
MTEANLEAEGGKKKGQHFFRKFLVAKKKQASLGLLT